MRNKLIVGLFFCIILILLIGLASTWDDNGSLTQNVDGCNILNTTNATYTLTDNVSSQGTCFTISAQNITLDCNNYWINYSIGGAADTYGIATDQFNATIKNCNVLDGNWTTTNVARYGINLVGGYNSTFYNNFVNVSNSIAIVISTLANFNNLTNNTGISNSSRGISIEFGASNNLLKDNIGQCLSNGYGIALQGNAENNTLENNIGISLSNVGIRVYNSSNNNFINNTGISNSSQGISTQISYNNTFTENNGTSNSSIGISVNEDNSTFIRNIGTSNSSQGISLTGDNLLLINNTGISNYDMALYIHDTVNCTLIGQNAIGVSTNSDAIVIETSDNDTFRDCGNITGVSQDISLWHSMNITFINCSYNLNKESVTSLSNLTRKWYYQAYVNYTNTTESAGVNISAYNITGDLQFTTLTNGSGWIERQEVTEYVNTEGIIGYYNNYTINANKSGTSNDTNIFNFTTQQNKVNDWFTLDEEQIVGENSCGTLLTAGQTYTLTSNVSSTGICFNIAADNVTLDCNGYWINYSIGGASSTSGVYSDMDNTTIKNCNIIDGNWSATDIYRNGIYLSGDNGLLQNNSVITNNSMAIYLYVSQNSSLINNTAIGNSKNGLLLTGSSNNVLINNTWQSNVESGIRVRNSNNITLINNTGITSYNGGYQGGIEVYNSTNSTLMNCTGTSTNSSYGLYFDFSQNNTIINSTGISNSGHGIVLFLSSDTIFINPTAIGLLAGSRGIYTSNSSNLTFRDCVNITGVSYDVRLVTGSMNNTFINCSYNSNNEELLSGNELTRKWYYQAYANYTNTTEASNVNVTAYNSSGAIQFTALTNSSGFIQRQEVIEYVNTGGTRAYYNNYTINASLVGYTTESNEFNFTTQQNKVDDMFTLNEAGTPGEDICGTLNIPGQTYTLTQNVSSNGTCFTIAANNVTLNCNGYWINYSTGGEADTYGVYTDQFNTTIKNCNIIDGSNWSTGIGTDRHGLNLNGATFSNVYNNFVNSTNANTIRLTGADNANLTNNTGIGNSGYGMYIDNSDDVNLTNNIGTSEDNRAISAYSSNRIILINNTATSNTNYALMISSSENNTLINNTGISNTGRGMYIWYTNHTNFINNSGINSGSDYAIFILVSSNNTFINNSGISNTGRGIYLRESNNNTFVNQIARTTGASGSSRYGIYINDSEGTTFRDCINISGGTSDVYYYNFTGSINNTFINCTYNTSKENVTGAGNELIRKWYYQAYTNYSNGTAVVGTNVTAYNSTNNLQFTSLTNSSGLIERQEVTEYINTGGTRSYYNNYTIFANKSGYINDSNIFNFTTQQNKIDDVFTLDEEQIVGENACGILSTANTTYTLTSNVTSTGTCFTIAAANVTLDCNGYWINYSQGEFGYGITVLNYNNVTIKNCNVIDDVIATTTNFTHAIYLEDSSSSSIYNNTIKTIQDIADGISIYTSNYTILYNNTITNSGFYGHGIYIRSSSYNNVSDSKFDVNYYGIYLEYGSNNHNFSNLNITANNGGGVVFDLGSNNNTLFNTSITSSGYAQGIYMNESSNNILSDVRVISNSSRGLYIAGSNNTIANSSVSSNYNYSIHVFSGSNNTFVNNTLLSGLGSNLLLDVSSTSSNNLFYWNNFTQTSSYYINNSNSTNKFNTTIGGVAQGNYYYNITSKLIYDLNDNGWGESGSEYPLNATTWVTKWIGYGGDYGPGNVMTFPKYNSVSHNSTIAGERVKFSVNVTDKFPLHPNGQYIFSTNNSGSWVNNTAVNFTTTPSLVYTTKILNSTVGRIVGYRWYFNDSAGNKNSTRIYTLTTEEEEEEEEDDGDGGGSDDEEIIYKPSYSQIQKGYEGYFREEDKIQINLSTKGIYLIEIEEVNKFVGNVTFSFNETNYSAALDETIKINANNDSYYDLQVSVIAITFYNITRLNFKEINEEIAALNNLGMNGDVIGNKSTVTIFGGNNHGKKTLYFIVVGSIILAMLIVAAVLFIRLRKSKKYS